MKEACSSLTQVEPEMALTWEAGHDWLPRLWGLWTRCEVHLTKFIQGMGLAASRQLLASS